jgi:hypothetical protein
MPAAPALQGTVASREAMQVATLSGADRDEAEQAGMLDGGAELAAQRQIEAVQDRQRLDAAASVDVPSVGDARQRVDPRGGAHCRGYTVKLLMAATGG